MLKPAALEKGYAWTGFNGGFSGTKSSNQEGGHRIPFFVRWPAGKIGGGNENATLTSHFDLLPSFVDMCELKMPREVKFDGQSLKELWLTPDGETDLTNRTLVVHSQRVETPVKWKRCSVMKQNWRLINGKYLYHLETDRAQKKDISKRHPKIVAELRSSYDAWWDSVSEKFSQYVRIPLGSQAEPDVLLTCHDWHATEGEVPWNQGKIRSDLSSNGFWAVDVMQPGKYEITLRVRPTGVKYKFKSGKARIKVGEQEQQVSIEEGQDAITMSVDLPAGPALLQTWISEGKKVRGAYYVDVNQVR